MNRSIVLAGLLLLAPAAAPAPALAQGLPNLQGLGQAIPGLTQPETPAQKREFCGRVAGASARCAASGGLSLSVTALTSCLIRTLPPQDSLRVAQVAQRSQGSAGALLGECGIGP